MPALDNAHALLVGIANYQHTISLPETVLNDARSVADLLVDPQVGGYEPGQVTLLLDEQATQAGLRQALADLAQRSDADSTLFIYMSCHGGRIKSGPHAGEYLLPVDVEMRSVPRMAETAISGAEFSAALRRLPARRVVIIFDCCHAAGIGQPKDAAEPALKAGLSEQYYEALVAGRGRAILASSRSDEYSYILPGASNSLFTQHLLAGLRGAIPADDGLIRIFDLYNYVQPRVLKDHPSQHPVFKAELEENFAVALRLGGQPKAAPRAEDGFLYDAYLSFSDLESDAGWVWGTLIPLLEGAGLRLAISGVSIDPGVAIVQSREQVIGQARRTVIVLSPNYLADTLAEFENVLAQTMSVQEGRARLLVVQIAPIDEQQLSTRLGSLERIDLTDKYRARYLQPLLVETLGRPLSWSPAARYAGKAD